MQRLIVTSATYRQSSTVTPALLEKDPENRLLARGPRLRLPAEMIRDTALAVSGLLNDEIGGPSVLPYQPKGLWEEMAFGDGFSAQTYEQSHGPDLYRRGMYTFWKRTAPPASLATFDAPDREKCTGAAVDDEHAAAGPGADERSDLRRSGAGAGAAGAPRRRQGRPDARRATPSGSRPRARRPATRTASCASCSQTELRDVREEPAGGDQAPRRRRIAVRQAPEPAELAAWTTVASAILNLDETITKQ